MATYIKLEWGNSCDLGTIYYNGGFKNIVYFDSEIGEPGYENVEEGFENSEGVFIKTSEKLQKVYKFVVVVPEYLADALAALPLHDSIIISTTDGLFRQAVRNVRTDISPESITNSCLFTVEVRFQLNDQIIKDNCCVNM